jgi:hypothetical protein
MQLHVLFFSGIHCHKSEANNKLKNISDNYDIYSECQDIIAGIAAGLIVIMYVKTFKTVIGPLILKLFLGETKEKMHEGKIKLF